MSVIDPASMLNDIDNYFDRLEDAITQLEEQLLGFQSLTAAAEFTQLETSATELATSLADLEALLDQRGTLLLRLADDGKRPKSLRAFLKSSGDRERLERAEQLAAKVEQQRQRSITIFTAHYWLHETTQQIIRMIINPGPNPGTYGIKVRSHGGGLFDEAA